MGFHDKLKESRAGFDNVASGASVLAMHYWNFPFTAHGCDDYEVRVVFDGLTFRVRAFLNNAPVNRFEYSVSLERAMDLENLQGQDAVNELVRIAEDHVRRGIR